MESKNFKITLPATTHFDGDIIVTDPCYYMPDNIWHELINMWFEDNEETEFTNQGVINFSNGVKVIYSSTAYGDGEFPVFVEGAGKSVHNDTTGVDAGLISVILVSDIKKLQEDYGLHNNEPFNVDDTRYPRINGFNGIVEADGEGNFIGDLEVNTEDKPEEDDYDSQYDDEDDELDRYQYNDDDEDEDIDEE